MNFVILTQGTAERAAVFRDRAAIVAGDRAHDGDTPGRFISTLVGGA
ncbi:hypothetical protein [Elioraea sp.]|nr:hypothetical protein [Elioraea sp.]